MRKETAEDLIIECGTVNGRQVWTAGVVVVGNYNYYQYLSLKESGTTDD